MKLILKKESYVPQTFVSKELLLKKYMQSFFKWIYFQNSNYSKYLTREEISNYFLIRLSIHYGMNSLILKKWLK